MQEPSHIIVSNHHYVLRIKCPIAYQIAGDSHQRTDRQRAMIRVDLRRAADMNRATADNPVADEAAGARQRIYATEQHKAWRLILYALKLDTGRVDGVVGSQEPFDSYERA